MRGSHRTTEHRFSAGSARIEISTGAVLPSVRSSCASSQILCTYHCCIFIDQCFRYAAEQSSSGKSAENAAKHKGTGDGQSEGVELAKRGAEFAFGIEQLSTICPKGLCSETQTVLELISGRTRILVTRPDRRNLLLA